MGAPSPPLSPLASGESGTQRSGGRGSPRSVESGTQRTVESGTPRSEGGIHGEGGEGRASPPRRASSLGPQEAIPALLGLGMGAPGAASGMPGAASGTPGVRQGDVGGVGGADGQGERRRLFLSPANGAPEGQQQYQPELYQQQQQQQQQEDYLQPVPLPGHPRSPAETLTPECLKALVARLDTPTDWLAFALVSKAWRAAAAQGPERLRLEPGRRLCARGLQRALLSCGRVRELLVPKGSLDGPVSDDLLCTLGYTCPDLERVVLSADPALGACAFTPLGLDALFSGCTSLRELALEAHFGAPSDFTAHVAPRASLVGPSPGHVGPKPFLLRPSSARDAPDSWHVAPSPARSEPADGVRSWQEGQGQEEKGQGQGHAEVQRQGEGKDGTDSTCVAGPRMGEALRVEKERAVRAVQGLLSAIRTHSGSLGDQKWAERVQETLGTGLEQGLEAAIAEVERRLPAARRRCAGAQRAVVEGVERELQRLRSASEGALGLKGLGLGAPQGGLEGAAGAPILQRGDTTPTKQSMGGLTAEALGGRFTPPWVQGTIIGGQRGSPGTGPRSRGEAEAVYSASQSPRFEAETRGCGGAPGARPTATAGAVQGAGAEGGVRGGGAGQRQRRVALYSIPPSLGSLQSLTSLTLKFAHEPTQVRIPEEIRGLASLTHLHLGFTHTPIVPAPLWALGPLRHLELAGWKGLALLPNCMGELVSLETLRLQCVDLQDVPPSLGALRHLTALEWEPPRCAPGVLAKLPPPSPSQPPSPSPAPNPSADADPPPASSTSRASGQSAEAGAPLVHPSDSVTDGPGSEQQSGEQAPVGDITGSGGSASRVVEADTPGIPPRDTGLPDSPSSQGVTTDVPLDDPRGEDADMAPDADVAADADMAPPAASAQSPAVEVASAVAHGVAAAAATAAATAVAGAGLIRDSVPWGTLLSASPAQGWGGKGVGNGTGSTPGCAPGARTGGTGGTPLASGGGGSNSCDSWLLAEAAGVPASLPALTALRQLSLRDVSRLPEKPSEYPPNLTALRVWGPQGAHRHRLSYVPNALIHLRKLEDLELRGDFPGVPAGLGALRSLQRLVLASPYIEGLPLSTSNLVSLTELRVEGCCRGIFRLPDSLFASLPKLKHLSLPSMPGSVIPASICQLSDLTYLSIEQPSPSPFLSPSPPAAQGTPADHPPPSPPLWKSPSGAPQQHAMGTPGPGQDGKGGEGSPSPVLLGREQSTQPRLVDTVLGPWSFVSAREKPWTFARERLHTLGAALGTPGVYPGTGTGTGESKSWLTSQNSASGGGASSDGMGAVPGGQNGATTGRGMEFHSIPVPLSLPSPSRVPSSSASLPPTLGSLPSLETFRLRCPHITMLPRTFAALPRLTDLELQFSGPLPRDFGQLAALKFLVLDSPAVYTLPESFGELSALTEVTFNCPGMVILPNSFGCLSRLSKLTFLQCHSLSGLPPSFGALSGLRSLQLRSKALACLPRSFCFLKNLRDLTLESHILTELPENFGMLTTLRSLHLHCPLLQRLPGTFSNLPPDVLMQVSTDLLGLSHASKSGDLTVNT